MQYTRPVSNQNVAMLTFPELVAPGGGYRTLLRSKPDFDLHKATSPEVRLGHVRATVLSFLNMHAHGELLVSFLRARKKTFIDRLSWQLPIADGMEYDQYDTPACRWIVIHEFGEVIGGVRITPTTALCGIYSYMLRDAQKGLLDEIPSDVLFFEAPVSPSIWEASRLFISQDVPSHRRVVVQSMLMETLSSAARDLGAEPIQVDRRENGHADLHFAGARRMLGGVVHIHLQWVRFGRGLE